MEIKNYSLIFLVVSMFYARWRQGFHALLSSPLGPLKSSFRAIAIKVNTQEMDRVAFDGRFINYLVPENLCLGKNALKQELGTAMPGGFQNLETRYRSSQKKREATFRLPQSCQPID